jgi:hypothetical protein
MHITGARAIAHYDPIVTLPPKKVAKTAARTVTEASTPTTRRNVRIVAQTLFNSTHPESEFTS